MSSSSNIKNLVNTYFPSKNTVYKDDLLGTNMIREADQRPYSEKKQELIGIICRQLNDGDGISFTPDFGQHEYIVVYGSVLRSAHRWFLRTEDMFDHVTPATIEVNKKWKKTLKDFNIELSDEQVKELKTLEDIDSIACLKNEVYLINDDAEYPVKFFCMNDTSRIYTIGSLYDRKDSILNGLETDELFKRLNDNIKQLYGEDSLKEINKYMYDSMMAVYNNSSNHLMDINEAKNFNINANMIVDTPMSKFLNSRIEKILDQIVKKYRKNVGSVIDIADVGVTLWQIK